MPLNLNLIARVGVINECLSSRTKKYWSKSALIEKILEVEGIAISERSFVSDINKMKNSSQLGFYAPIEYSKARDGYFYTDPDYSTGKLPLNAIELKALRLAASTLSQYKNIPLLNAFTSTIDKVVKFVKRTDQETVFNFIDFEKTPFASGMEFMDQLIEAIQSKTAVLINYKKFGEASAEQFIIHPYLLKEYRNRWYVIAFSELRKAIRIYALDRMVAVGEASSAYIPNELINKNFLGDCIGINLGNGEVENILLKFTEGEGDYLKTQAMHKSQEIVEDKGNTVVISLKVIVNFELVGIILGYGAKVTVLEPPHLAETVVKIAKNVLSNYEVAEP